jgi:hypothetical protein
MVMVVGAGSPSHVGREKAKKPITRASSNQAPKQTHDEQNGEHSIHRTVRAPDDSMEREEAIATERVAREESDRTGDEGRS